MIMIGPWHTFLSEYKTWKKGVSGTHIHFFPESSAGRVSLMAYLPGSNLGSPGKSTELKKE